MAKILEFVFYLVLLVGGGALVLTTGVQLFREFPHLYLKCMHSIVTHLVFIEGEVSCRVSAGYTLFFSIGVALSYASVTNLVDMLRKWWEGVQQQPED